MVKWNGMEQIVYNATSTKGIRFTSQTTAILQTERKKGTTEQIMIQEK